MKIIDIHHVVTPGKSKRVIDSEVGSGYVKDAHGSLPDIDSDFNADRREEVKAYLERRYNKNGLQRVFSAGTFTTLKIRSVIKDVARTYRIPQSTTNYLTAILEDDKMTWTDLMRLAATDKRIMDFISKYPDVFEEILPLMMQPRSAGIHASAIIIIPEFVKGERIECFDLLPIRKMGDLLVSEISGDEIDKIGILKNDVLGIKELTRLSDMLNLIESECHAKYTILEIATKYLDDPKVYEIVKQGNTQGLFQMNNDGMTKFLKRMKPDNIHDLIAAVALYRPGPLNSGAADNYVRAKNGEYNPEYLWGTYDALQNTFAQTVFQEQVSQIAREVGSLSISDSVNLVKVLSKKKLKEVRKFHDKFFDGAKKNGCPIDAAKKIWSNVEDAAKYAFNMAHATAYGLTAYIGAWIKAYYPTVFYAVVLRDQDEKKLPILLNEIDGIGEVTLENPNINISGDNFVADFATNKIYWSLSRIKQLGPKAVNYIMLERKLYGEFTDLEDFIKRIFKNKFKSFDDEGDEKAKERCPVTARSVQNLIFAGAFDECEKVGSVCERFGLMSRAAMLLGFTLSEDDFPKELRDKHYFWSRQQIIVSGQGAIDYCRICNSFEKPKGAQSSPFIHFRDLNDRFLTLKKGILCATIISVVDRTYKDRQTGQTKHFGKIELQQNTEVNILTIWDDWNLYKKELQKSVGKILIAQANIKWSDYDEKNVLQMGKVSFFKIV